MADLLLLTPASGGSAQVLPALGLLSHRVRVLPVEPSALVDAPDADIVVLDALRRKRNLSDYEGDPVSEATLTEAKAQAVKLLTHTETWLRANRPDAMGDA